MPEQADNPVSGFTSTEAEAELAALRDSGFGAVQHVAATGSTNADLLDAPLAETPAAPVLRWADHQLNGRGRRGRQWVTGPGQALTFSVALERHNHDHAVGVPLSAFSLVAGLVIAEVLDASGLCTEPVQLKWPNDVLISQRKVAGILIEARYRAEVQRMVVGCGVNLIAPASGSIAAPSVQALPPGGVLQPGNTSLDGDERERNNAPSLSAHAAARLVAQFALALQAGYKQFFTEGLDSFAGRWSDRHCYQGQSIMLMDGERVIAQGLCAGIDSQGALVLDSDSGRQAFSIGEVSARPLAGPGSVLPSGASS